MTQENLNMNKARYDLSYKIINKENSGITINNLDQTIKNPGAGVSFVISADNKNYLMFFRNSVRKIFATAAAGACDTQESLAENASREAQEELYQTIIDKATIEGEITAEGVQNYLNVKGSDDIENGKFISDDEAEGLATALTTLSKNDLYQKMINAASSDNLTNKQSSLCSATKTGKDEPSFQKATFLVDGIEAGNTEELSALSKALTAVAKILCPKYDDVKKYKEVAGKEKYLSARDRAIIGLKEKGFEDDGMKLQYKTIMKEYGEKFPILNHTEFNVFEFADIEEFKKLDPNNGGSIEFLGQEKETKLSGQQACVCHQGYNDNLRVSPSIKDATATATSNKQQATSNSK